MGPGFAGRQHSLDLQDPRALRGAIYHFGFCIVLPINQSWFPLEKKYYIYILAFLTGVWWWSIYPGFTLWVDRAAVATIGLRLHFQRCQPIPVGFIGVVQRRRFANPRVEKIYTLAL